MEPGLVPDVEERTPVGHRPWSAPPHWSHDAQTHTGETDPLTQDVVTGGQSLVQGVSRPGRLSAMGNVVGDRRHSVVRRESYSRYRPADAPGRSWEEGPLTANHDVVDNLDPIVSQATGDGLARQCPLSLDVLVYHQHRRRAAVGQEVTGHELCGGRTIPWQGRQV